MQRYSIINSFIVSCFFVQIMLKFLVIRIIYKIIRANNREHFQIKSILHTNAILDYYVQTFEYLEQKARFSVR